MSRLEKYNKEYGLAYGQDHIFGNFIQVWRLDPHHSHFSFENMPDSDNIEIDKDGITVDEIVKIAEDYGFDLSAELGEKEIQLD